MLPVLVVLTKWTCRRHHASTTCLPGIIENVAVAATSGRGTGELLAAVERILRQEDRQLDLLIPFTQAGLLSLVRRYGRLEAQEYLPEGITHPGGAPAAGRKKFEREL